MDQDPSESLREEIKKASHTGLLLGAVSLVIGALVCLVYLLIYKPWKFPG